MTPNEILAAAVHRSSRTRGQQLTAGSEPLEVTKRGVRGVFAVAALVNPVYFAVTANMVYNGQSWPWPSDVEGFIRLEVTATRAEVAVIPFDDRHTPAEPSVFALGQAFHPAGAANDPAADLTAFYSPRPTDPATADNDIDARFPAAYYDILINDLALYLALKDGREPDVVSFRSERNRWLIMFAAHVKSVLSVVEVRRFAALSRTTPEELIQVFGGI